MMDIDYVCNNIPASIQAQLDEPVYVPHEPLYIPPFLPHYYKWKDVPHKYKAFGGWKKVGRKVVIGSEPRAKMVFDDGATVINLYEEDQTREYRPTKFTKAVWALLDWLKPDRNKYRFQPDEEDRLWYECQQKYVRDDVFAAGFRGKDKISFFAKSWAAYVVYDLDFHDGFYRHDQLKAVYKRLQGKKWFASAGKTGIHFWRCYRRGKKREELLAIGKEIVKEIKAECPDIKLEVKVDIRLPICKGRKLITNKIWDDDYKAQTIHLAGYVYRGEQEHVSLDKILALYPETTITEATKATLDAKTINQRHTGQVVYKGQFFRIAAEFLSGKLVPEADTVGSYIGPILRFAAAAGYEQEEVTDFLADCLENLPDTSFSDRIQAGKTRDIFRSARKIWSCNGYQPDSDESDAIWAQVVQAAQHRGFDLLDPTTWDQKGKQPLAAYDLDFDQRLVIKHVLQPILKASSADCYKVARRILGFVQTNPDSQLAAVLVPKLCQDAEINWYTYSDHKEGRCKKAEKVLSALVSIGFLYVRTKKVWRGASKKFNLAKGYGIGAALRPAPETKVQYDGNNREWSILPQPRQGNLHLFITDSQFYPLFSCDDDSRLFEQELTRLAGSWDTS